MLQNGKKLMLQLSENFRQDDPYPPQKVYRYFKDEDKKTEDAVKNFLKGNLWFAGPNQNRFDRQNPKRDPSEYRHGGASIISTSALSLSLDSPSETKAFKEYEYCIEIDLINFVDSIEHDLKNANISSHSISWLEKESLRPYADKYNLPAIRIVEPYVSSCIGLQIGVMKTRAIEYGDKSIEAQPLSLDELNLAYNKDHKDKDDREYRIELTTSFFNVTGEMPDPSLFHLIQHIKLNCPSTANYMKQILAPCYVLS